MSQELRIETFALGAWMTNCYVLVAGDGEAWIVDAGFEPEAMLDAIAREGWRPTRVVLTHAHLDHIGGLWDVRRAYPEIPIHVHEAEREFLTDTFLNLSAFLDDPTTGPEATDLMRHGDVLTLGGHPIEVRHTPGHSPGNVCLFIPDAGAAINGDTLFAGGVGRTDFPTSDAAALQRSIREQLYTLPDETRILPGHGPETTVRREKRTNPYVRG